MVIRHVLALAAAAAAVGAQSPIAIDAHQHLMSPAIAALAGRQPITADRLILSLDSANIRRAIVLSTAYQFGNPNRPAVENEYEKVKAENDWTAAQVAKYPDRLRAFCSVNPLKDYALEEIARCARIPGLRNGLKLHFGNSDVDLDNPDHVAKLRRVFAAANEHGMPIAAHMHANVNLKRPYGAKEARVFLEQVVPEAKDIAVQIAHLSGAGGYADPATDEALSFFVDAVRRHDPRMDRVWFDVSGVVSPGLSGDRKALVAQRVKELGIGRIVFGIDAFAGTVPFPEMISAFRSIPLTTAELDAIQTNIPPYLR